MRPVLKVARARLILYDDAVLCNDLDDGINVLSFLSFFGDRV